MLLVSDGLTLSHWQASFSPGLSVESRVSTAVWKQREGWTAPTGVRVGAGVGSTDPGESSVNWVWHGCSAATEHLAGGHESESYVYSFDLNLFKGEKIQ